MKFLKVALVVTVILVNWVFAQPSWADKPNFTKNPDYIEVTKTIKKLQENTQGTVSEDVQSQIDELQFQKAAIESGMTWGQCRNQTGKTIAIYGPVPEESNSKYDNQLYFLANDQTTPDGWDCQGVYLPKDVKVASLDNTGAVAVKVMDGTQLSVKKNPDTSELELNQPSAKVINPDESKWFIPNVSQAFVDSRIPSTFATGEND
ncbi:hypothetical protein [Anabaena azotica]|uniref:Uncharacterized protein n=1 Tax=Anabaena azotica FACHB-119 TaxID=947527 RepID=A0ABR8CXE7_9NOST|nr:hypothetical protein [Anabaena azotica]MBD2499487.1 hypothetical protein [Anabaena azotica FACHB-119]